MESEESKPAAKKRDPLAQVLRLILGVVLGLIAAAAIWLGFIYAVSPESIRHPARTHYHFRMQVINDGQPVNFADSRFQTEFNQDICTAALTAQPIHFHDHLDQFVHIHWDHITGGILLKNYGWNFIGGPGSILGYKFNGLHWPVAVPIHGAALPKTAQNGQYYVYTGTADNFRERDWGQFLHQDLRQFFAGQPVLASDSEKSAAKLNDVIGNVIIFAQMDKPTDAQVKARFQHVVPLPASQCSG